MKERINISLNTEIRKELKRQADENGLNVSAYLTVLIKNAQKKGDQ